MASSRPERPNPHLARPTAEMGERADFGGGGRERSRSRSPADRGGDSGGDRRGGGDRGGDRGGGGGGGGGGRETGVALRWKGRYGFIKPDDGGDNLFCHRDFIEDGKCLIEGSKVKYMRAYNEHHRKICAKQVTGGAPEPEGGFGGDGCGGGGGHGVGGGYGGGGPSYGGFGGGGGGANEVRSGASRPFRTVTEARAHRGGLLHPTLPPSILLALTLTL